MEVLKYFSDFLSLITILSCLVIKFPQISSINKVKSANGINTYGLLLELSSYTTTACYNYVNNYALLSYMEYPIIITQEYILIFLVLKYKNLFNTRTYMFIVIYFSVTLGFISHILPPSLLTLIIPLCTPVSLSSKAIQLWEILHSRNADSVSVVTWLISAFTNLRLVKWELLNKTLKPRKSKFPQLGIISKTARVFTIFMDSADKILLTNFILSAMLSSCIALATKYYQTKKQI